MPRPRRRYKVGAPGLVYLVLTLLVALGAFNSQNNLLFWAFGFSLGLLVVSGIMSGSMLSSLEVTRESVTQPRAGSAVVMRYRIRNRSRVWPAFALTVTEGSAGVAEEARLGGGRAFAAHVGRGESLLVDAEVRAVRRGAVDLGSIVVSSAFPFGIVTKSLVFAAPLRVLVWPAAIRSDPGRLDRLRSESYRGGAPTRRGGPGDEFFALREYSPGDPMRAVAWKPSARRGAGGDPPTLLVRQHAAPAPARVMIRLHLGAGAGDGASDEEVISRAAGLVEGLAHAGMPFGLAVPAAGVHVPPREGPAHVRAVLDLLAVVGPGERAAGARLMAGAPATAFTRAAWIDVGDAGAGL